MEKKIKIRELDACYDKTVKYQKAEIQYMSKKKSRHSGSDDCDVRGFFILRKPGTDNRLMIGANTFDCLDSKNKLYKLMGFVKDEEGNLYGLIKCRLPFYVVWLILLILCMAILINCLGNHGAGTQDNAIWTPQIDEGIYNDDAGILEEIERKQITIHGFTDWTIPAGQTDSLPIALENPEGNPCYFSFSIVLQDGTRLYESDHVPPGETLSNITINEALEEGDHQASVYITTAEIGTGTPMNSARTEITIHVI